MATWEDRFQALMARGVFESVSYDNILFEGDPTAGTPAWQEDMAFSMPIQQYLDRGKIVGALKAEVGIGDTLTSIAPNAPGQIIVVNGKPNTFLLHRLGTLLNLPLEVVPGHYAALNWIPLRAIPSRVVKPPSIRIVSVGLLNPEIGEEEIRSPDFLGRGRPGDIKLSRRMGTIPIGGHIYHQIDYLDSLGSTFCAVEQHVSFYAYYQSQNSWSGLLLCDIGSEPDFAGGLSDSNARGLQQNLSPLPRASFQPWKNFNHITVPEFGDTKPGRQYPELFEWRLSMDETMSIEQRKYCQQDPFAFMADLLETSALS